ncbi:MAG: PDZ domain-containing protein [Balneolales bacterium]|nr:PDZ domain-containing protein [Balneolales bacterium]
MKQLCSFILFISISIHLYSQTYHEYLISFENAVHHEAHIEVIFPNLDEEPLEIRMSRTSPGRYAIHNFAKNVYGVEAFDSQGNELEIYRPNPQQWDVAGHDGTVVFKYTLFANRGDGTYSQVNESHAHLNIPATFVYARNYMHRPVRIDFDVREDLNWRVATQLKREGITTYSAPDGYYFMDSPVLIADFHLREEMVDGQLIRLALHTEANDNEVNEYFSKVMAIVRAQRNIFGELPEFDFGEYTFLCNFTPSASGDGMEHRNSTIVTGSKQLEDPLAEFRMSTISHEFIHVWNVERLRPASLEPFDFEEANMSGELWFAEGFTSYYTGLAMVRAGILSQADYIEGRANSINYVFNSPGRQFFNPIEMSYRAPFVDAATSIDPTNNSNIFVSYYAYGSVLGLALDLMLRAREDEKNLDGYMRLLWRTYGKTEIPYSIRDLEDALGIYTDEEFASQFFNNFIYESGMPDYQYLFNQVGVNFGLAEPNKAYIGGNIRNQGGVWKLTENAQIGTPLYEAGIEATDEIVSIAGVRLSGNNSVEEILENRRPGQTVSVIYRRWGQERSARVTLGRTPDYKAEISRRANREARAKREAWLNTN